MTLEGARTPAGEELRAEAAVVGSGPGGAITACCLAEAGRSLILLEEGPALAQESCPPFSPEELRQKYRCSGLTVALGRPNISYVEGRVVGGGSEINSGLYHRTPPAVLAEWRRDFEVRGLEEADLRLHFEAVEKDLEPRAGPPVAAGLKLAAGRERSGLAAVETPRIGAGGRRRPMSETFLPRALKAGALLLADTRVLSLRRESGGWTLRARRSCGRPVSVRAGAVFLCAGATQTPAILRRSGIRDRIGQSLRLHPMLKVIAQFPEAVNAEGMGVPARQILDESRELMFGCSISAPEHLALGLADYPQTLKGLASDWRTMAAYYAMISPAGTGEVRCLPGLDDPVIRFRLTDGDLGRLAQRAKLLAGLLCEAGAVRLYPGVFGIEPLGGRDALRAWPERISRGALRLMTIHLFSSCPMGENRRLCAADSFGKVHGHEGLYVNDASLLCSSPHVNPQGTIMAVARRNALRFLAG